MDTRRFSLILILGGVVVTVLALVWFVTAYADAMDTASRFWGEDQPARLMTCLYSTPTICQGATMLSDGPGYSPIVFWIGVIALLGGIVVRFAAARNAAPVGSESAGTERAPDSGEILSFIPPAQYARYSYILALGGAVAGLILTPLAVVALAGFALALLGLTVYRDRLNELDARHLGLICLIFAAAGLLLWVTRGTFLFLLAALAQITCFYVAFNSYRHGRVVTTNNLKDELLAALKPGAQPLPDREQQ